MTTCTCVCTVHTCCFLITESYNCICTCTCRYTNVLLKRVSQGGVCYSKNRNAFVSRRAMQFKAEEYSDVQGDFVMCQ